MLGGMTGYHHVDVFSEVAYAGNSLAVFVDPPQLTDGQLRRITRELRHFETIFVTTPAEAEPVRARVFDLFGELDFAGHPVLGAAAVLHELAGTDTEREWKFALPARTVAVRTRRDAGGRLSALLDQGRPELIAPAAPLDEVAIAASVGLDRADLDPELPPEIMSTGLRYLIVPVRPGALGRARIARPDFAEFLSRLGAEFAYLLDAAALEGRHWNNDGIVEDVATGSAAGCAAGYLLRYHRIDDSVTAVLAQGRFTGRPSRISITGYGTPDNVTRVTVGGPVTVVGAGSLRVLPAGDLA
jgi:trans-2,3-dihydro-3-hydroxyanthranilate isomerase